jgi:predicted TIM-barrel fold metal-dependent hydrolase
LVAQAQCAAAHEEYLMLTRRSFLATTGAAAVGALWGRTVKAAFEPRRPLVDFHVHLFGVGDEGTGCFISERQRDHLNYRFFLRLLGIGENGHMDRDYVAEMVRQLEESTIDRALLLAQDGRYDRKGLLDRESTNFYVPNEYLFQVVQRYPSLFASCASINPKRRDAIEELDRCAENGAQAIKIHPSTQDVDPGEQRFRPFYRRLTEHRLLLIVHTGMEHASEVVGHEFSRPSRLVSALEEGCTVVAAHAGMGAFFDPQDFFPELVTLVEHYPKLYCDSAVLASMFRWRNLPRILGEPTVLERLVHASDWPFPSNAMVFWNRLSPIRLLGLSSQSNLFERDFRLKAELGLPAAVFERGAELLGDTRTGT